MLSTISTISIKMAWRNLGTFLQNYLKIRPTLSEKMIFYVFSIAIKGKIAPPSGSHVFQPINMSWRNLIEGLPRNISTKLFENWPNTFGGEVFSSFHYSHIRQNSPATWQPCFSTNQLGLKEYDKDLVTQVTFLQNYLKIGLTLSEKFFQVFTIAL